MNEISDFWSLPWHDLQRRLASSASPVNPRDCAAGSPVSVAAQTVSWIVRAQLNSGPGRGVKPRVS